jgi:hypothetical protein
MSGKRLVSAVVVFVVALALLIGPMPGLMNIPSAHAAKGDSYLTAVNFDDNQLETLFWLVPIGLITPFMWWYDMHNDAY